MLDSTQLDQPPAASFTAPSPRVFRFGVRRMFLLTAVVSVPFATIQCVSGFSIFLTFCVAVSFGAAVLVYRDQDAKRVLNAIKLTITGILAGWFLTYVLAPRIMGDNRWVTEIDLVGIVLGPIVVWLTAYKEGR